VTSYSAREVHHRHIDHHLKFQGILEFVSWLHHQRSFHSHPSMQKKTMPICRPVTSFFIGGGPVPPFPFPLSSFPFSPPPFPSLLSSSLPFPSFPCLYPKNPARGSFWRSAVSSPSGSGRNPATKCIFLQLKVKMSQITLINWHVHNICQ